MSQSINAKSVTRNVGWSVLSKTSTFGLKFVTVPILARLLTPEEFGGVAVALAVVQFLAMIGGAGLASALILEPREDEETIASGTASRCTRASSPPTPRSRIPGRKPLET